MSTKPGFTIVELLIVIAVIALLALIGMTAYANVQKEARTARSKHDLGVLARTIIAVRADKGQTLNQITGRTYTVGPCIGNGIDPSQLNKNTHPCWTQFREALDKISAATHTDFSSLYNGTQYGHPFYIDENEKEDDDEPCRKDVIADRGKDFLQTQGDEVTYNLPWSITECDTVP